MSVDLGLSIIKNRYASFTAAEAKCADAVLENPAEMSQMTVAMLAEKAGAAQSAVIRFCKKAGFSSFTELKLAVLLELEQKDDEYPFMPEIRENNTEEEIIGIVFSSGIKTLRDTLTLVNRQALIEIADKITKARRVCIWALGTSAPVAEDAVLRLTHLGIEAYCSNDPAAIRIRQMNMNENDLVIGVSHSGRTKEIVDALAAARDAGVPTVAVTGFPGSPIFKYSDCTVQIFSADTHYQMEAASARLAYYCVFDTISSIISNRNRSKTHNQMKQVREILNKLRY